MGPVQVDQEQADLRLAHSARALETLSFFNLDVCCLDDFYESRGVGTNQF